MGRRSVAVSSILILASAFALLCASAAQASTVSPLPASDYSTQPACAVPAAGHVACLAEILVPRTAAARAHTHPLGITTIHAIVHGDAAEGADGLRPQDLRDAYFPGEEPDAPTSEPQTLAIVDAYNDPEAEADLRIYDEEFHLPECTTNNGCFEQVNQNGETGSPPFPSNTTAKGEKEALCESTTAEPSVTQAACRTIEEVDGWSLEVSLDIETAHAICQNCHIVLVEAEGEDTALETAEDTAVRLGAGEVSNSWAGSELLSDSDAFNHPGVVITFAAGDRGYLNWERDKLEEELFGETAGVNYPASSPHVIAVGGTTLKLNGVTGAWSEESVWDGTGGGCSLNFEAQPWQDEVSGWSSVGCEDRRAVNDVSADANPYTGVAIYDSVPYIPLGGGLKSANVFDWTPVGGTSASTPMIAAMFALAGGSHGVAYPAQTLYSHLGSAALHDIAEGSSGKCFGKYSSGCSGSMSPLSLTDCGQGALICNSATGYDGPTGVGTPNGLSALQPARQRKGGGPEAPLTEACAGAVFTSTGKVCGTLNPHTNSIAGYYFTYNKGASCVGGKETAVQPEAQGESIQVSGELFGLEADTQYSYCLVATDSSGETMGPTITFTSEPAVPRDPLALPATDVTTSSATFEGELGPQPIATSLYFRYAPQYICTSEHASTTPEQQDTKLGEEDEISVPVSGLQPGTQYHVCLVATNRIGSTTGSENTFMTKPAPPSVESVGAVSGSPTEVTLEGRVSPNAQEATCEFLYGTSDSYGLVVPCQEGLGNNGERTHAHAHVANLAPGTTYYFQIVVNNESGKSSPSEGRGTFTTQSVGGSSKPTGEGGTTLPGAIEPLPVNPQIQKEFWEHPPWDQAPATVPKEAAAATSVVSLASTHLEIKKDGEARVKLTCAGTATCTGKLTLTAESRKRDGLRRDEKARTETIGTIAFSIAAGKTATVELELNATGRALLSTDHGRLSASLTILKSSPAPSQTHAVTIHLAQQKLHGKIKR